MPFKYAHVVQVLVDATLWSYPFMIFSLGTNLLLGVAGTLALTTCYQGLFDLAKQFLDPFHNENFWSGNDALVVDTLIAETNANSVRWMNCIESMPITVREIATGSLDEYILPTDGYTVEEAAQNEAIKRQEAERKEKLSTIVSTPTTEESIALLEDTENELEETVAILNAQPGLDFVPGLDDGGESLAFHKSYGRNTTDASPLVEFEQTKDEGNELADQFFEATDDQLKNVKELVDESEGTVIPPFS